MKLVRAFGHPQTGRPPKSWILAILALSTCILPVPLRADPPFTAQETDEWIAAKAAYEKEEEEFLKGLNRVEWPIRRRWRAFQDPHPYIRHLQAWEGLFEEAIGKTHTRAELIEWCRRRFGQPYADAVLNARLPFAAHAIHSGGELTPQYLWGDRSPLRVTEGRFQWWRSNYLADRQRWRTFVDQGRVTPEEVQEIKKTVGPPSNREREVISLWNTFALTQPDWMRWPPMSNTADFANPAFQEWWGHPGRQFRLFLGDAVRRAKDLSQFFTWIRQAYGEAAVDLVREVGEWAVPGPVENAATPAETVKAWIHPQNRGKAGVGHLSFRNWLTGEAMDPVETHKHEPGPKGSWGVFQLDPEGFAYAALGPGGRARTRLGVEVAPRTDGGKGLVVITVRAGGPAEEAGVKPGDVFDVIQNEPLRTMNEWKRLTERAAPASLMELMGVRVRQGLTWHLRVASDPDPLRPSK